jgi:leucyl/phenylalanyl-tRNA--protein transferase
MRRSRPAVIPADLLVSAYTHGWFPMAGDDSVIRWYSPDPRGIIPLDAFHVPSRLARVVRSGRFEIRIDTSFAEVIRACAEAERDLEDSGSWISGEIEESYRALHHAGIAHSVEAWRDGRLVGGLYGVAIGGAFFGESMFHRATDASKVALTALVDRLRERGYRLLDTQWVTDHLVQFGAVEIPRSTYLKLLDESLQLSCRFLP